LPLAKSIAEIIQFNLNDGQAFLSPFVGGGWVECLIRGKKECSDKHNYGNRRLNQILGVLKIKRKLE